MDTTNLRTGVSAKPVLVDFLQEVQVKSSGYNAEYRATTGGVVSAVTKSGGNVYHGGAGVYYTNDDWAGAVRPAIRLNPANQTIAEYTTTPRDPSYGVDPIFDIGGPILRDKAWFYFGYGPQLVKSDRTVTFTANNPTGQATTFNNDSEDHSLNYTRVVAADDEHPREVLRQQPAPIRRLDAAWPRKPTAPARPIRRSFRIRFTPTDTPTPMLVSSRG